MLIVAGENPRPAALSDSPVFGRQQKNRPFYRYGGHIELLRLKEYYGIPRGYEHDPIYLLSIYVCFPDQFWSLSFPRKRL